MAAVPLVAGIRPQQSGAAGHPRLGISHRGDGLRRPGGGRSGAGLRVHPLRRAGGTDAGGPGAGGRARALLPLQPRRPTAGGGQSVLDVGTLTAGARSSRSMAAGRFAPSPTGDLHLGNLRTALVAWLFARLVGLAVRRPHGGPRSARPRVPRTRRGQLPTSPPSASTGTARWCGSPTASTTYEAAIAQLDASGLTYPLLLLATARSARRRPLRTGRLRRRLSRHVPRPHPAERGRATEAGRPPALRLRAERGPGGIHRPAGRAGGGGGRRPRAARNDGVPAYNLAVVIDDAGQGIGEVVRGDDLLLSTPRQLHLGRLLGLPESGVRPRAVGARTGRPAAGQAARRGHPGRRRRLRSDAGRRARSAGGEPRPRGARRAVSPAELIRRFDPSLLPRRPWVLDP